MKSEEKKDWHWLLSIPVSYVGQRKLIQYYGTPAEVRRAPEEKVAEIIGKENISAEYLKESKKTDWEEMYGKMLEKGIELTLRTEENYPDSLQPLLDAPYGLYHIGKLPEETLCVAVIGARSCSRYGLEVARELGAQLARASVPVISGMARGIDGAAQWSALQNGGKSYAVLGCGVDICYPKENEPLYERLKENGTLISEYPPGTEGLPWRFPYRNRIISGLCRALVVVEARKRSGTLITTEYALEYGRDIYAVPGRMTDSLSEGCNELIQNGAAILVSSGQLLADFGIAAEQKEKNFKKTGRGLAKKENLVYSCLDLTPKGAEAIKSETGLPVTEIMGALGSLQVKGLVVEAGAGCYALAGTEGSV